MQNENSSLAHSRSAVYVNRIAGGIGAVAPWWPIKAYRPCPNYLKNGGIYKKSGQGLDEIAFGRDSTYKNKRN